jgi:hypothetical protein
MGVKYLQQDKNFFKDSTLYLFHEKDMLFGRPKQYLKQNTVTKIACNGNVQFFNSF